MKHKTLLIVGGVLLAWHYANRGKGTPNLFDMLAGQQGATGGGNPGLQQQAYPGGQPPARSGIGYNTNPYNPWVVY